MLTTINVTSDLQIVFLSDNVWQMPWNNLQDAMTSTILIYTICALAITTHGRRYSSTPPPRLTSILLPPDDEAPPPSPFPSPSSTPHAPPPLFHTIPHPPFTCILSPLKAQHRLNYLSFPWTNKFAKWWNELKTSISQVRGFWWWLGEGEEGMGGDMGDMGL